MGPKKGRRVRKRKFSLPVFLNLSWGTQWQISSGGEKRGRPDRKRGTATATELGEGKEGGGKKKAQDRKVILKQRLLEERWEHHSRVLEGAHDQHLSH